MNPSDIMSVCMAIPRRYKNYNEQTQAEMDRFYGKENSGEVRSQPTYVDYDTGMYKRPEKPEPEIQEYVPNVRINGKPATPKAAGIFLTIFGSVYIFIALMVGIIMAAIGAPIFVYLILSVFFIVGAVTCGIGIRFLRKKQ